MFYTGMTMQLRSVTQSKKTNKLKSKNDLRVTKKVSKTAPSSYVKKLKRYTKQGVKSLLLSPVFHSTFRMVSITFISLAFIYGSYFFIGKTFANEVVVSQSEIIARVSKLTMLPVEDPYEIVRVQDATDLRKQNNFYKDINEGDYILIYRDLAVIYDLRNNTIKGVRRPGDR